MAFAQERDQGGMVDKLVTIKRVAKVVKGGRRFAFSAIVVVGDENGRVGWGSGKAKEVPDAVRKATDAAKKAMVRVPLRDGRTLHHDIQGEFSGSKVVLRPAKPGRGIIAGGPMRAVFEALGIKDVVAKSLGSSNPYNMIQATFEAFSALQTPRNIAAKRGLKLADLKQNRSSILDLIEVPSVETATSTAEATKAKAIDPEEVKRKSLEKQAAAKAEKERQKSLKKESIAPEYLNKEAEASTEVAEEASEGENA